jgi:prepilin-type N-terminal cleavage/methylation domain-containing protein/prepilin-type processing-associated H-X9-DG protein
MRKNKAFTLVELLVVIGIISVLVAILLPALSKARQSAARIKCMANMKQIHLGFAMYSLDNDGWYPPVCDEKSFTSSTSGRQGLYVAGAGTWPFFIGRYIGLPKVLPGVGVSATTIYNKSVLVCPNWSDTERKLERNILGGYGMSRYLPPYTTSAWIATTTIVSTPGGADYAGQYMSYSRVNTIKHSTEWVLITDGNGGNGDMQTAYQFRLATDTSIDKYRHMSKTHDDTSGGANFIYLDGHCVWLSSKEILNRSFKEYSALVGKKINSNTIVGPLLTMPAKFN